MVVRVGWSARWPAALRLAAIPMRSAGEPWAKPGSYKIGNNDRTHVRCYACWRVGWAGRAGGKPKAETRNPKEGRNPKSENRIRQLTL